MIAWLHDCMIELTISYITQIFNIPKQADPNNKKTMNLLVREKKKSARRGPRDTIFITELVGNTL